MDIIDDFKFSSIRSRIFFHIVYYRNHHHLRSASIKTEYTKDNKTIIFSTMKYHSSSFDPVS